MQVECLEFTESDICSLWSVDPLTIGIPIFAIVFLLTLIVINKYFKK